MTLEQATLTIRAEMAMAPGSAAKAFWKGVLVGLGCGRNLNGLPQYTNLNIELMKDLANAQGTDRNVCVP